MSSKFKNSLGITALAAVSIPFGLWFWLSFVDIVAVAFRQDFWNIESLHETKGKDSKETESVVMVASLRYAHGVRCHMVTFITPAGDDVIVTYSYRLEAPSYFTQYVTDKALYGCMQVASAKLHEMADIEDAERQAREAKPDDGKI